MYVWLFCTALDLLQSVLFGSFGPIGGTQTFYFRLLDENIASVQPFGKVCALESVFCRQITPLNYHLSRVNGHVYHLRCAQDITWDRSVHSFTHTKHQQSEICLRRMACILVKLISKTHICQICHINSAKTMPGRNLLFFGMCSNGRTPKAMKNDGHI